MFSTITKFNKELGDSVLNLNYLLYLIVFTYLIIPNYFTKLTNKFVIYLPKLPFELILSIIMCKHSSRVTEC